MKDNKLGIMPISKLIWNMSLPIIVSMLVQALYNIVDSVFVSQVSEQALTAVTLAFPAQNLMIGLATGTAVGVNALLGRALGAGDGKRADQVAINGIFLAVVGFVLSAVLALCFAGTFFRTQTDIDYIVDNGITYLRICCCASLGMFCQIMFERLLQGTGRSILSMYTQGLGAIVNIVLDIVLVAVIPLGVAGAAIATVASQVVSAVLTVRCIHGSQGMPWHLQLKNIRIERSVLLAICRIGLPGAAQSALYSISNMTIQSAINGFGTVAVAAWSVYGKIDFLFWMTVSSFGIAVTTFAGQNFGARQYDRVRRGVRVCLAMAACTTLVISFTFYNLAEVLFRLFSQDDAVVAVGVGMMHVLTPVYITYVCIEVLAGALRGCGDVRVPTLITVFFVCGLRMLWLFIAVPIRHEVATVEMSYPITWSLASALFILYYVKGGWMQRCAEKWEKKQAG